VVLRLEREKDTDLALQKLFNGDKRQKYEWLHTLCKFWTPSVHKEGTKERVIPKQFLRNSFFSSSPKWLSKIATVIILYKLISFKPHNNSIIFTLHMRGGGFGWQDRKWLSQNQTQDCLTPNLLLTQHNPMLGCARLLALRWERSCVWESTAEENGVQAWEDNEGKERNFWGLLP
jgi:hypothetical protein